MFTDPFKIEIDEPGTLSMSARPRGHDWLEKEIISWSKSGITHLVSLLEPSEALQLGLRDEAYYAEQNAIRFTSYSIPDMSTPTSVNDFLELALQLAQEIQNHQWIHVHCRAGIGRSAILVCTILYFLGFEPQDAIDLTSQGRRLQIPDTIEQTEFIIQIPELINSWDGLIVS